MDGCQALHRVHRRRESDAIKLSSVPVEKRNGTATHPSRTREVNSRYKSATPPDSRRCASPNVARTVNASAQLTAKRAISAGRRRPSTPPSPSPSTTPVQDTSIELQSRKVAGSRLPESSLWPSTMRSLSVSFQSDSISIPVSKKEKSVSPARSDRTLKPSSNVAQKKAERASALGKPAPEKRSPSRGRTSSDQLENSRPVDGLEARLIDQHRWPSRGGGNNRRLSAEGMLRPLHRTTSDYGAEGQALLKAVDETMLRVSILNKLSLPKPSTSPNSVIPGINSHSLSVSRLPSPSKASASRGTSSPTRTRPSTPTYSRGTSPSRIRPCSPTRKLSTATSVLTFASDLKKGKKSASLLEDAHRLRLLYNRFIQWRFANAQADAALHIQKVMAEETLYNVWWANLELWDSVITKRINLQQLQLGLKLNAVLNEQLAYLEGWASLERDHSTSLAGVINDLESSTLRLPITGGARADVVSLKAAMSSAVDVMHAMTSSIHSVFSKVEETNCSVSELAEIAALERATLDECDSMLASTASTQVEAYSLRVQLIQQLQELRQNNVHLVRAI